jgi:hypothetical protein
MAKKKSKASAQPIQTHMEKKSFPKMGRSEIERKHPLKSSTHGEMDSYTGKPPKR